MGNLGGDGYNHFRVCEGKTATFSCGGRKVIHIGACWYGSPSTDPGYNQCPHSAKKNCAAVTGNCGPYLQGQCENKASCSVTINNVNMGGDPCPGVYKFGAIAAQCRAPR